MVKKLFRALNQADQDLLKVLIIFNRNVYKTLGTSIFYSPMASPFLSKYIQLTAPLTSRSSIIEEAG